MNHEIFRLVLKAVLIAMLGGLIVSVGLLAFHRRRARLPQIDRLSGSAVLQYHWTWRLLAAVLALDCLIFPMLGLYSPPGAWGWSVLGATSVVSFGGSIALLVESSRVRITVDDGGIRCRSPWHRDRFMRWEEITRISWRLANGLEVRSDAGKLIIPLYVQGLPYLFDCIRSRVPQQLYRETGIQHLQSSPELQVR